MSKTEAKNALGFLSEEVGRLKAEKRQSKEEGGAPPLDKRDTVTKLAHLGWSAQEIARTTRLSRGEVELILELAPKK